MLISTCDSHMLIPNPPALWGGARGRSLYPAGVHLDQPNIALHKAVQANAFAKVLFILGAGADINSEVWGGASHPHIDGQPGSRPFFSGWRGGEGHEAWSPDDPWIERQGLPWVERGGQYPSWDDLVKAGITPLMRACACKYCVDVYDPGLLGAREEQRDEKRDESDSVRDATMIKLLLQLGADPNVGVWRNGELDIFYETALNLCFGDLDLMKCLLAHGADPNAHRGEVDDQDHVYEVPFLHIACGINDIDPFDAHGGRERHMCVCARC